MEFSRLPAFEKDLKKLKKRFRTLDDDLAVFEKFLDVSSHPQAPHTVRISDLGIEEPLIIKVRTFACKSLKGKGARSGIRIIYAYLPEKEHVEFVEIYYKGDKPLENRDRIVQQYRT